MSDYAPKSPDLSGFYSAADPTSPPRPPSQQRYSQAPASSTFNPHSAVYAATSAPRPAPTYPDYPHHYGAADSPPHGLGFQPPPASYGYLGSQEPVSPYPQAPQQLPPQSQQPPHHQQYLAPQTQPPPSHPQTIPGQLSPYGVQPPSSFQQQHHQPPLQQPQGVAAPYGQPYLSPQQYPPASYYQPPLSASHEQELHEQIAAGPFLGGPAAAGSSIASPLGPVHANMPPRRGTAAAQPPPPPAAVIEPSPVKTKFPTARIKRIMQADEEVGKVAQQTPIAVGKALELFMVSLVRMSADVARDKNSKRVTAQMLKEVVETDDQWDFLRDIVGKVEVEEKKGGSSKVKPGAETESEEDEGPKKKGKGGRKKKV